MGCVATKLEEEGEVVGICRDRKRLLKQAVERRRALAAAHFNYCQALYAVSAAIKLFVARHASPSSPFLITFPSSSPAPEAVTDGTTTTAMYLQQKPSESTSKSEAVGCLSSDEEEEEGHNVLVHAGEQHPYGYRYYEMERTAAAAMASPPRDFGWDFFNLFDGMRAEGYTKTTCYNEDLRIVRQQEGIPELEEEDNKVVEGSEVVVNSSSKDKVVVVKDDSSCCNLDEEEEEKQGGGRELLETLRDIESHFIKAYHSGKHVCTMLELVPPTSNHLQSPPPLQEFKVNPTKLIQAAITWHRSASFNVAGSCKSLVESSSYTWSEYKNGLFDQDYGGGGMVSGSHSLTLDRLYAWEKKLYDQVKAGDGVRKLYEKKCAQMRNQDVRLDNRFFRPDKTGAAVKDLYARILVSIRSAESISGTIDKLRDEELHPQIIELLKGMRNTWKSMLESHETQKKILREVVSLDCPGLYGKQQLCNDSSHRLATLQLEAELHNWRSCLAQYVTAQKSYVQTLHSWLAKFLLPPPDASYRAATGPGLLPVCHEWLKLLENLPDKSAGFALKSFAKDLRCLRAMQGEELQQKRKVEALEKELEKKKRRTKSFNSNKIEEIKTLHLQQQLEEYTYTAADEEEEPDPVEAALRMRVQVEREKHERLIQEAKQATLTGFRAGFCAVFDSLTDFGMASHNMYTRIAVSAASVADAPTTS